MNRYGIPLSWDTSFPPCSRGSSARMSVLISTILNAWPLDHKKDNLLVKANTTISD